MMTSSLIGLRIRPLPTGQVPQDLELGVVGGYAFKHAARGGA
jgi:hypothetical protein